MKTNPPKDAQQRALTMITKYLSDDDGLVGFPIDPFSLAEKLGIKVEFRTDLPPDVSGLMLQKDKDAPIIAVINADDPPNRQRFTMAHELGHYSYYRTHRSSDEQLGLVERRQEISGAGTDPYERDANGFAAELLMPEYVVNLLQWRGKTRSEMAKTFGVSLEAMGYRLNKLGFSDIV